MVIINILKTIGWCILLFIIVKAGPGLVGALTVFGMMGLVRFFSPRGKG